MPTVIDIKSIIEQYAPQVQWRGRASWSKDGLEYHGSCPWCGGTDRFAVWPEKGRYSCAIRSSGCGRYGDAIDFLKDFEGLSYREACNELDIDVNPDYRDIAYPVIDMPEDVPPKTWQERGLALVHVAEYHLWHTPAGAKYLDYLHGRGFKDEIIKQKRLGYLPLTKAGKWLFEPFDVWGLTEDMLFSHQWEKGGVRVPDGLLIPWIVKDELWKLTVRRPFVDSKKEMSKGQITGSQQCLYNADLLKNGTPVMMVEGVFDALSVEQEAGDLVACVATDGTMHARAFRWLSKVLCALSGEGSALLQSFDADEAGEDGAAWWLKIFKKYNVLRWVPSMHDTNDMLTSCEDIRKWVQYGLVFARMPSYVPETVVAPSVIEKPSPITTLLPEASQAESLTTLELADRCSVCDLSIETWNVEFFYNEHGDLYCERHRGWETPPSWRGEQSMLPRPTSACRFCKGVCQWIWSEVDTGWICFSCLSPVSGPVKLY